MLKIKNGKILAEETFAALNRKLALEELLEILLGEPVSLEPAEEIAEIQKERSFRLRSPGGFELLLDLSQFGGEFNYFLKTAECAVNLHRAGGRYFLDDPENCRRALKCYRYTMRSSRGLSGEMVAAIPSELSLYKKGNPVESLEDTGKIVLSLGGIELGALDFLKLAPGSRIECEFPPSFKARLNLGSKEFAEAEAVISPEGLILNISRTFPAG